MVKRKLDDISEGDADTLGEGASKKSKLEGALSLDVDGCGPTSERRSARIAARRSGPDQSASVQSLCSDADSETELELATAKNKRKSRKSSSLGKVTNNKRRKNSKVGRLEALMHMPVDIFCEIANHLSPHDLLSLARSSKALRNLLGSKRSKAIWRAARDAMEMPDCPSDLSEMQYANLVFCKGCYLCDAPRAQETYFPLRLRLCARCRDRNLVTRWKLRRILQCSEEVEALLPGDFLFYKHYNINEAQVVWNDLKALAVGSTEHANFVAERKRKVAEIEESASYIQLWVQMQEEIKSFEREDIIVKRKLIVETRLRLKGYTDKDLDASLDTTYLRSRWAELLRDPKPMTDRIWKNIESKLDTIIAERRVRRLAIEELATILMHNPECECGECMDFDGSYCNCAECMAALDYFSYVTFSDIDDEDEDDF